MSMSVLTSTYVVEHSVFEKRSWRPNQSSLFLSVSFKFIFIDTEYDIKVCLPVFFEVFSLNKVQGRKIPGFIKKLNRALGLPSKSERVWDILFISDLKLNVTENAENINNNGENINTNTENIDNNMADLIYLLVNVTENAENINNNGENINNNADNIDNNMADILIISDLKVNITENAENINKNAENINNNEENINNNAKSIDNNMAKIKKYHPESKWLRRIA